MKNEISFSISLSSWALLCSNKWAREKQQKIIERKQKIIERKQKRKNWKKFIFRFFFSYSPWKLYTKSTKHFFRSQFLTMKATSERRWGELSKRNHFSCLFEELEILHSHWMTAKTFIDRFNVEADSDSDWGRMYAFHIRNGKLFSPKPALAEAYYVPLFSSSRAHSLSPHSKPIRRKIHYRKGKKRARRWGSMCLTVCFFCSSSTPFIEPSRRDDNGKAGNWDCWAFQVTFALLDGFFDS